MKKRIYSFYFLVFFYATGLQIRGQQHIIPISHIDKVMKEEAKPILLYLTSGQCKYCALQKRQLEKMGFYAEKADYFYFIEWDINGEDSFLFAGEFHIFRAVGLGSGRHTFVDWLNVDSRALPAWVLFDPNYNKIFERQGFINEREWVELCSAIYTFAEELPKDTINK